VDSFDKLSRKLLGQFMAGRTRKKPFGYLLTLQQKSSETLKEFVAGFNVEKMTVEDPPDSRPKFSL
jgi:hypothetical protein